MNTENLSEDELELITTLRKNKHHKRWLERFEKLPKPITKDLFLQELYIFLFYTSDEDLESKKIFFEKMLTNLINATKKGR